jgi:enoyl-CoA hydratase
MSVRVERDDRIALVTLDRPEQLNALSNQLMNELVGALEELDADPGIRCIVLAGNDRAFAAGADIAELADASAMDMLRQRRVEQWDSIRGLRTPLVAAVSGFCLGGGCELAMACDLIVASETAKFGQPETGLGIIPGAGGSSPGRRGSRRPSGSHAPSPRRAQSPSSSRRPRSTGLSTRRSRWASTTRGAPSTSPSPPRTRRRV